MRKGELLSDRVWERIGSIAGAVASAGFISVIGMALGGSYINFVKKDAASKLDTQTRRLERIYQDRNKKVGSALREKYARINGDDRVLDLTELGALVSDAGDEGIVDNHTKFIVYNPDLPEGVYNDPFVARGRRETFNHEDVVYIPIGVARGMLDDDFLEGRE